VEASIELKQFDPSGASARALAAAIDRAGVAQERLIVQSFFPPNLAAARAALPGVALSTLTVKAGEATSIQSAVDAGAAWVSPQFPVDAAYVEAAHAAGLKVVPFTLNTEADIRTAAQLGIDAIITDDPVMAQRVLRG
jgi:glycerophosphoryl diester phosphodiesterase